MLARTWLVKLVQMAGVHSGGKKRELAWLVFSSRLTNKLFIELAEFLVLVSNLFDRSNQGCNVCLAHRCVCSSAAFWSLTAHSGQWPELALKRSVAIDPKQTLTGTDNFTADQPEALCSYGLGAT